MSGDDTITLGTDDVANNRMAPMIPARLGPVRLERPLGQGGMGVVWLGYHEILARPVAVKLVLGAGQNSDSIAVQRFLEGARAAAAIRHPGLTSIHHADLVEGIPYLVMDYVEGPTLADVLKRQSAFQPRVVQYVMSALCDAVDALHERDLVHRDIKPANVLLDRDGNVFVTDFGLTGWRSGSGGVAGTPAYMAPECFEGAATPRSDVFALGVCAYEMLTGARPFEEADVGATTLVRPARSLPTELLLEKGASVEWVDLIGRAAHPEPIYRYKRARHLLQALPADGLTFDRAGARAELADIIAHPSSQSSDKPVQFSATATLTGSHQVSELAEKRRDQRTPGELPSARESACDSDIETSRAMPPEAAVKEICVNVQCVTCGYNLRGLTRAGNCPECGAAVSESTAPNRLCFADIRWLRGVRRGLRWAATTTWLLFLLVLSVPSLSPFLRRLGGHGGGFARLLDMSLVAVPILGFGIILPGVLFVTRRESGNAGVAGRKRRLAARWLAMGLLALLILSGLDLVQTLVRYRGVDSDPNLIARPLMQVVGSVLLYLPLIGTAILMSYISLLSVRTHEPRLGSRARILAWWCILSVVGVTIAGAGLVAKLLPPNIVEIVKIVFVISLLVLTILIASCFAAHARMITRVMRSQERA